MPPAEHSYKVLRRQPCYTLETLERAVTRSRNAILDVDAGPPGDKGLWMEMLQSLFMHSPRIGKLVLTNNVVVIDLKGLLDVISAAQFPHLIHFGCWDTEDNAIFLGAMLERLQETAMALVKVELHCGMSFPVHAYNRLWSRTENLTIFGKGVDLAFMAFDSTAGGLRRLVLGAFVLKLLHPPTPGNTTVCPTLGALYLFSCDVRDLYGVRLPVLTHLDILYATQPVGPTPWSRTTIELPMLATLELHCCTAPWAILCCLDCPVLQTLIIEDEIEEPDVDDLKEGFLSWARQSPRRANPITFIWTRVTNTLPISEVLLTFRRVTRMRFTGREVLHVRDLVAGLAGDGSEALLLPELTGLDIVWRGDLEHEAEIRIMVAELRGTRDAVQVESSSVDLQSSES